MSEDLLAPFDDNIKCKYCGSDMFIAQDRTPVIPSNSSDALWWSACCSNENGEADLFCAYSYVETAAFERKTDLIKALTRG